MTEGTKKETVRKLIQVALNAQIHDKLMVERHQERMPGANLGSIHAQYQSRVNHLQACLDWVTEMAETSV